MFVGWKVFCLILGLLFLASGTQFASAQKESKSAKVLVIAHRGASGYRPEHTLAAYELAIDMGADFIEPDLVPTKDGHLVARHENEISGTTDVAEHPEFAAKKTKKAIDGEAKEGWFTEDFTLAELKTLRAKERMPLIRQHNTIYDRRYEIPTFQEVIDLAQRRGKELKVQREIGLYPEAKHPSYFESIGLPIEKTIVETLHKNGYKSASAPVFIQSFEPASLKKLRAMTELKLVQLIDQEGRPFDWTTQKDPRTWADMIKPEGLVEIAKYANGIGPSKNLIVGRDKEGRLLQPGSLVSDAHKAGLVVHPWTFRNENPFLPLEFRIGKDAGSVQDQPRDGRYGKAFDEYKLFYNLAVDGVFSENPDTAVEARSL